MMRIFIGVFLALLMLVPVAQANNSNVDHLYLYEKNPDTWEIVDDGAWGKMRYRLSGPLFDFVFNGHGLVPGYEYALIYYPDPWPGEGLICLGYDMADDEGNVHIKDKVATGDLPAEYDDNYGMGAKLWLVLAMDVDCEMAYMVGWNPVEYLFESELITFDYIEPGERAGDPADAIAGRAPSDSWSAVKALF